MKTYRLYLDVFLKALLIGAVTLFLVVAVMGFVSEIQREGLDSFSLWFVMWLGLLVWVAYRCLAVPHLIEVDSDRIRFVSLVRTVDVSPREIESIKPLRGSYGFLVVRHQRGKIWLLNRFDGFHEFLTNLESANPRIELRGC